ncbi:MAG: FAD-binding protein [Deltaproteobacteria bacterium]|nr:FAD-binding protein [Deltaproteobacteria bacterium]
MAQTDLYHLIENPEVLKEHGQDFGRIQFSNPLGVLRPTSVQELQSLIVDLTKKKIRVNIQGSAHTANGQSQCDQGVVIDLKSFNQVVQTGYDQDPPWINVQAGILWEEVLKHSLAHGLTPPTTTDWQKLSVGGTLSTGGVGFMSYQKGIQADQVLELEVVTADGEHLVCSHNKNKRLFNLVRAGFGQFGWITHAKLKLEKAPKYLEVLQCFCDSSKNFHQLIETLVQDAYFDCIHAFLIPKSLDEMKKKVSNSDHNALEKTWDQDQKATPQWIYFIELAKYRNHANPDPEVLKKIDLSLIWNNFLTQNRESFFDYIHKEPPLIEIQKKLGNLAHPELAILHPANHFVSWMDDFIMNLKIKDMGGGPILIIPLLSDKIHCPLFRHPIKGMFYFIGILRVEDQNSPTRLKILQQKNLELYQKSIQKGGFRYPCDSLEQPNCPKEWRIHFGEETWKKIEEGKKIFNSNHILTNSLGWFD